MTTLSTNLKKLRNKNNLSQQQIAHVITVKLKTYQAWENRNIEPPINKLSALAKLYKITVDELINAKPQPKPFDLEQKLLTAPQHIQKAIYTLLGSE